MGEGDQGAQRVRAGLLAALVLSLAAGAHVLAGDALPAPALVVALAAVTLAVASVLGRRRLRRRTLVPALVAGQWALHHAFVLLAGPVHPAGALPPGSGYGAHVHGSTVLPAMDAAAAAGGVLDATTATAAMTLAHALAAAVTALVAVSADRAWDAAVTWATTLLPVLAALLAAVVPSGAPRARWSRPVRVQVPAAVTLGTRPRRGPPAVLLPA